MEPDHYRWNTSRSSTDGSNESYEESASIQHHAANASLSSSFRRVSFSPFFQVVGNEPEDKALGLAMCLTPRRSSRILSESFSSLHGSIQSLGETGRGEKEDNDVEVGSLQSPIYDR
jgi:hypothetical protein